MHVSPILAVQESANVLNKSSGLTLCKATLVPEGCKSLRSRGWMCVRHLDFVEELLLYVCCTIDVSCPLYLFSKKRDLACRVQEMIMSTCKWCFEARTCSYSPYLNFHPGFSFLKQLATVFLTWINMQHYTMWIPYNLQFVNKHSSTWSLHTVVYYCYGHHLPVAHEIQQPSRFRGGLSICASARGLAELMASEDWS